VISPFIFFLNFITRIFDVILSPFQGIDPIYGLLIIAVLTGIIMVTIFSKVSNQEKMGKIKNLIKAHFLELRIYKNDIYETLSAQKKILRYNLSYIKLAFIPATIMFIPILFILIQMNLRFGYRSLLPGETVVVRLTLRDGDPMQVRLKLPPNVKLDIPPLRIPHLQEVNWRIIAGDAGEFDLEFFSGGKKTVQRLIVSSQLNRCYPTATSPDLENVFLNPGHPNYLAVDSPFRNIEINYPQRNLGLGLSFLPDWLVIFFAVSIVSGLILKKTLKIH
jgi:uncharacterized membrane protein (DUF106 family)